MPMHGRGADAPGPPGPPTALVELTAAELDELHRLILAAMRVTPAGSGRDLLASLLISLRAARATIR